MAAVEPHVLPDRGVIALSGIVARTWLDNLVAGDLAGLDTVPLAFTALLSPQGKILFEFFVWKLAQGLFIDVAAEQNESLMKRLRMYKLRAQVDIADASAEWAVTWGRGAAPGGALLAVVARDPRSEGDLWRGLVRKADASRLPVGGPYMAARVALGIGEAPHDYALGDIFPHEANMDRNGGVSFTKGCYVGQEVVSRMQHKTVVRKRVVPVDADGPLATGADVMVSSAVIGRIGSTAERSGLALVRLDRIVEALGKGAVVAAAGRRISVDPTVIARYRQSILDKPVVDL